VRQFGNRRRDRFVVFSDEKIFLLQGPLITQNERVYSGRRKRLVPSRRSVVFFCCLFVLNAFVVRLCLEGNHFSRGLMVWAGISWNGKCALHIFDERERVDGARYRRLLADVVFPSARALYPDGDFVYQQDSARSHTARETIALLEQEAPNFIVPNLWPANSPDLNPCDYRLWAHMQQKVYANGHPANLQELRNRLITEWEAIPLQTIQQWIAEWIPRMRRCVQMRGKHIQQYFNKV
jgi:hypothetical protein